MESYTHNLKIILLDNNGNIVLDNDFLDEIKNTLCRLNTKHIQWNNQNIEIMIQWNKKELNNIEKQFQGDLFAIPLYQDRVIYNHTTQVISSINNKSNYDIKFYISRLIGDKTICSDSDSFGII